MKKRRKKKAETQKTCLLMWEKYSNERRTRRKAIFIPKNIFFRINANENFTQQTW